VKKNKKTRSATKIREGRQDSRRGSRRGDSDARLQLPAGQPDLEALRSVTREWLVPSLVEKFLRLHGIELKHARIAPAKTASK